MEGARIRGSEGARALPGRSPGKPDPRIEGHAQKSGISTLVQDACFCYFISMKLEINPRGNGACPLCGNNKNCGIKRKIGSNADEINPSSIEEMEIVIYTCPYFKEMTDQ